MPFENAILDASAVLMWFLREPGAEAVQARLEGGNCHISSVNVAEIVTRGSRISMDQGAQFYRWVIGMNMQVHAFNGDLALQTGLLEPLTRKRGLSLGDRACLALAQQLGAEVLTADQSWLELGLPLRIINIRSI